MKKTILSHREMAGFCSGLAMLIHAGIGLSDGFICWQKRLRVRKKDDMKCWPRPWIWVRSSPRP